MAKPELAAGGVSGARINTTEQLAAVCLTSTRAAPLAQLSSPSLGNSISNRNIARLETRLTPAKSLRVLRLIATNSYLADQGARSSNATRFTIGGGASPAQLPVVQPAPAILIDRAYQLEIDVTLCKINETSLSNRRWIAVSANRILRPIFATPNVDTSASRRLTCLPGEISCSQETRR